MNTGSLVAAVLLIITMLTPARAENKDAIPPEATAYGMDYGEWSAEFWQWLWSLPADAHPLFDTADCSAGQMGKVWFLGGTFTFVADGTTVIGTADRDCTVPASTALFFPLINAEADTLDGSEATEEELRAEANFLIDHVVIDSLFCEVDGKPVENLDAFRAESPLFILGPVPENNVGSPAVPAGAIGIAVADGYYVMLPPLSVGSHTVDFGGAVVFTEEDDGFDFTFILDIAYDITVVPRRP